MADSDSWDADNFEPNEQIKKAAGLRDKWEGEDEEEDVKDNWDDEEEEQKVEVKTEEKAPEKKKLGTKLKEKEKKQEELRKRLEESQDNAQLTPEQETEEKLLLQKLQEESDLVLAHEAFGVDNSLQHTTTTNSASGIEAMCPSTKEDFVVFEKLLRDKISQFEKSVHYSSFLESLFRELCISLEIDDMKKISSSLSVLLTEKQKQEKEKAKGKKKKKTVPSSGGLKAKLKDDLDDYGNFEGGYNDYEDFM